MASVLEYLRYLVDPVKAGDQRIAFTLAVDGEPATHSVMLRNGVLIISTVGQQRRSMSPRPRTSWRISCSALHRCPAMRRNCPVSERSLIAASSCRGRAF